MNEQNTQSFEEMLEASIKTLNTGDTVVGIVTSISNNEIHLDLGAKTTGVITHDQITDDTSVKLDELFKIGDEVEIINNIDFTSTAGAFTGNVGDYTVEFEPVATTLEQNGSGYIVASLGEASGYVPYTVYMARDDFMTEHPDIIEAFTRAIYRGQQWVEEHPSKEIAKIILPQFPESDVETLTTIIERYKTQDTWKTDPVFSEDGFTLIQDIMEQGGELSQRVPFTDLVRNEFAEKVTKQ